LDFSITTRLKFRHKSYHLRENSLLSWKQGITSFEQGIDGLGAGKIPLVCEVERSIIDKRRTVATTLGLLPASMRRIIDFPMERFDLIAGSEGRLLAFCEAGVLFELPWAKAKLGAATATKFLPRPP
jgi:hypothetical protein